jgi:hypothetical protein
METNQTKTREAPSPAAVFADPVAYLAQFGIEAELVSADGTTLATAA